MSEYLFDVHDPLGRRIVLSQETWVRHVLREGKHPELDGYVEAVRLTIERPHVVWPSGRSNTSQVYFRLGAVPAHPGLYVKVPVSFKLDPGTVSTAQLQEDAVQGTDPRGRAIYVNWRW